jgi:hypothetical protein
MGCQDSGGVAGSEFADVTIAVGTANGPRLEDVRTGLVRYLHGPELKTLPGCLEAI